MVNALNQYKQVNLGASTQTATPHELINMLFRGALEAMARASGAIERKDIELRTQQLNKAIDIVMNLQGSLDKEKGGEIAENLDNLYGYITRKLIEANRNNDLAAVQEASKLIAEIAEGWNEIPVEYRKQDV